MPAEGGGSLTADHARLENATVQMRHFDLPNRLHSRQDTHRPFSDRFIFENLGRFRVDILRPTLSALR